MEQNQSKAHQEFKLQILNLEKKLEIKIHEQKDLEKKFLQIQRERDDLYDGFVAKIQALQSIYGIKNQVCIFTSNMYWI